MPKAQVRDEYVADGLRAVGKGLAQVLSGVSMFARAGGDERGARVIVAVSRVVGLPMGIAADIIEGQGPDMLGIGTQIAGAVGKIQSAIRAADGDAEPAAVEAGRGR